MKANLMLLVLALCGFLVVITTAQSLGVSAADVILFNGKVITVDAQDHIYQAVAIKDGKIQKVGSDTEIKALAGPGCKMIDLKGKTVTPGLIDSHYHQMYYGQAFWPGYLDIRLPVVTSKASLLQVLGEYAKQKSPGEWISGNQGFTLQADETIDRWDLDKVAPNNPVYLRHTSGQYAAVNSLALSIAGINRNTPNPPSSRIMRDSLGEPNGILSHYPAENLVARYATGYGDRTNEQKLTDLDVGQTVCFRAGYTSIQDVIVSTLNDISLYKQYADSGRLKVRVFAMLYIDTEREADTVTKTFQPIVSDRFRFGGWKLAMDGGVGARTLLMYDSTLYAASISYPYHTQDTLNRIVKMLHNTGLQVAVHVSGDRGIDMTLTAFEEAMKANPRPDPRHRIEHGLFPSAAALQRMKSLNVILSTQPQWITWYGDGFLQATSAAAMDQLLPLKTMLTMGIPLAFGCDVPASPYQEPKWAFIGAVLRRTTRGTLLTQTEKLTAREALRIHTMGSAYSSFADSTTGSLEPGKFGDLVIWSHDLYTMSPPELNSLEAEMTIVGGEIVYDNGKNTVTSVGQSVNQATIPDRFTLSQNYPNPFNLTTVVSYSVPSPTGRDLVSTSGRDGQLPVVSDVKIVVFDLLGREVAVLVNEKKEPGSYSARLNASGLASGMYLCRLTAGHFVQTREMALIK